MNDAVLLKNGVPIIPGGPVCQSAVALEGPTGAGVLHNENVPALPGSAPGGPAGCCGWPLLMGCNGFP